MPNLSGNVQDVLRLAQTQADESNADSIGTHHVLYAIMMRPTATARALTNMGLGDEAVSALAGMTDERQPTRLRAPQRFRSGRYPEGPDDMAVPISRRFSRRTISAVSLARDVANRREAELVLEGHLVIGLWLAGGNAKHVLKQVGATLPGLKRILGA
jgi:hypothetical protein